MTNNTIRTLAVGATLATALLTSLVFGLLAIEHGLSLFLPRHELAATFTSALTSSDYIFGEGSLRYANEHYTTEVVKMLVHMALGGTALGVGALQFVPGMRRRFPRLHRIGGLVVWIATAASMAGAMAYLVSTPMALTASGGGFWLALWALALLTLGLLSQAILAVRARDYRSHMVWMALVFAALGTAPMLRVDWVVFYQVLPMDHEHINLVTTGFVLLQTIAVMAWWLATFGPRELPPRRREAPATRSPALVVLAAVGAAVMLHEGLLAPYGLDALAGLRDGADRLTPIGGAAAALPTFAALALLPSGLRAAARGERLPVSFVVAAFLAAAGWMVAGATLTADTLARTGVAACWIGTATFVMLALCASLVSRAGGAGRQGWAAIAGATLLTPVAWPAAVAVGLILGATFAEASYAALIVGSSACAVVGVMSGFGARIQVPGRVYGPARQPVGK